NRRERPAVGHGRQAHGLPGVAAPAGRRVRGGGRDLGAGLPQRRRPGRPGRLPGQAPPGLDRPLMAADLSALTADLVAETAWLDEVLGALAPAQWRLPPPPPRPTVARHGQPPAHL